MVSGGRKAARPVAHTVPKAALAKHHMVAAQAGEADTQTLVGCGRTRLEQELRIVDPTTCQPCAPGQVGEIWVAGPSVARGYWNNPDATAQTFEAHLADTGEGPFLRTGDLGCTRDGELFITGRLKDMLIIRGNNHYPQDLEETMEQSHPALRPGYGAAFSVEFEGEERLVLVQEIDRCHRPAQSSKAHLREVFTAVRQAVAEAHGLQVHAILLLRAGSVPKTTSGKIQRQACKIGFLTRSLNVIGAWHATPTPNRDGQANAMPARILPLSVGRDRCPVRIQCAVMPANVEAPARAA